VANSQFALLKTRRFLPLFLTQALGAFNDNGFKNALVILVTYRLAAEQGFSGPFFITVAAALFILPFFLFSATAGQIADKYEKGWLIHRIKFAEIILMLLAALSFHLQSVHL
jgi:acyl-[acyl-carrier-protein]-phospholipid O-acyltransferase/long-chain-fatty-acid--[acyl-carrier-protein] ligase